MSEYRNCITGELCGDIDFRKKVPNESFPLLISDEDLLKYGYERVFNSAKPIPTKNQIIALDGTEKDKNNKWVYKWKLVDIPKEILLAKLKAKQNQVWDNIQLMREKVSAGGILVNGNWFHTDNESFTKYLSLLIAGENIPSNILWKTMDGTKVPMTHLLIKDIYTACIVFSNTVFNIAESIKEQMLKSENPESFDITVGWPTVYKTL